MDFDQPKVIPCSRVYYYGEPIRIHPEILQPINGNRKATRFSKGFPACNAQKYYARALKAFFRLTGPLSSSL